MSRKIKVGLVQINNSFSGQNYFPYSVGILQAYAQRHMDQKDNYEFILPVYSRIPVESAVRQLESADIVGFSAYVWNFQISIRIAERLKKRNPGILIFFGGPHVPDRIEPFLRKYPFIDIACHGEGEKIFLSILENAVGGDWEKIPSISYLKKDGVLVQHPRVERIRDLSAVPSPYLEGIFDPLMKANPKEQWIVMWETNRGCPFQCTFCDWGSAVSAKVNSWDVERQYREIDWFAKHKIEFIFCADANFGILPRDLDIVRYCADTKKKFGYPQAMSVQNTKNATERSYQVQKILHDAGLNKGVVVSLQSVDRNTLKAIKRDNISLDTYHTIQQRFAAQGVETMSDLILGLPGESYESFASGVSTVIESGQHNRIQFNNLSILPNAEMGDPEYQKKYGMVLVESEVVNIHGELSSEEVTETQVLVVATNTMPKEDWVRTRAYAWMAGLLHFDKVLQIPIAVLRRLADVSYRDLIELFSEGTFLKFPGSSPAAFPVLTEVQEFFLDKAREIQNGGKEYVHSKEWLNIWWPADEYILIKMSMEGKLGAFYDEAERALSLFLESRAAPVPVDVLREAILLNRSLMKLPFQKKNLDLSFSHNIWEFYRSVVVGKPVDLADRISRYHINRTAETWDSWEDWARRVIWWGNKKGAYLYGNVPVEPEPELAGHY
ncbi:cobalamin B12-binding domain-containing protein [bacterium]|nr:cobalamin B12-binding domain-containing protein [bacterium]